MFRNYWLTAFRRLRRRPFFASIHLLGLAVGIASFLLVALFVRYETSFDNFQPDGDRVYRLVEYAGYGEKDWGAWVQGNPIAEMNDSYVDVEAAANIQGCGSGRIQLQERVAEDVSMQCTTPEFFEIFGGFSVIAGDASLLVRENTVVLSESVAESLGLEGDAVGRFVPIEFFQETKEMEIVGVFADMPKNSSISYDAIISYSTFETTNYCTDCGQPMWVKLKSGGSPENVAQLALRHIREVDGKQRVEDLRLEALADVHFSPIGSENQGDARYVYLLGTIALVILLIACVNYVNMSTAQSAERVHEIGVRKVMGAERRQVVRQVVSETVFLAVSALPLGFVMVSIAIPLFNELARTSVSIAQLGDPVMLLAVLGVLGVIGLLAGSYPSLYMSRFTPAAALSKRLAVGRGALLFRRSMVVFQFACTVVLVAGTVLVRNQLDFVSQMRLGFEEEGVVLVNLWDNHLAMNAAPIRDHMAGLAVVESASASGAGAPGARSFGRSGYFHGPPADEDAPIRFVTPAVDYHFIEAMGLDLVAGRNLATELPNEREAEVLINQAGLAAMGWQSPEEAIGGEIGRYRVVGVVNDFHLRSARQPIEPVLLTQNQWGQFNTLVVRTRGNDLPSILAALREGWDDMETGREFKYSFLSDEIALLYEQEQRIARIFGLFAGLAIVIACLGLFALSAYSAASRTKEIGIRKVLGAPVASVVALLSREFLLLVLVAFGVSIPIVLIAGNRWLEGFAFRTDVGISVFLITGGLAVVLAMVAAASQSLKAALADPVDSIRYE